MVQAPSIAHETAEHNHCYRLPSRQSLGSSRAGAIAHSRKSSCIQPVLHRGLKLSFFGQLLSPSCNISETFLAIQGPERLCKEQPIARGGQPIHSSDCTRGKDSKSLTAPAVLFQWGRSTHVVYSLYQGPSCDCYYSKKYYKHSTNLVLHVLRFCGTG